MRPSALFYCAYLLLLLLGLLCLICVAVWNRRWRGGFSWDGRNLQANWHPVLMVSGLLVLYGNAAVLFRLPCTWQQSKLTWKLLHAGLMLAALVLSGLGLYAVFNFHQHLNIPNLYSLHSWVGISTVLLFSAQWLLGLAGFLLPCSPLWFRRSLKPAHVWMGKAVLILSVASTISGINEDLFFALGDGSPEPYRSLPAEAIFANSLGLLIVAFGLVVFGILSKNSWQRLETAGESVQLLPSNNSS